MDRVYLCVGLLVLCVGVLGQDEDNFPDQWEAEQMPNPWRSPQHCNLQKQGFLCDPDRLLTDREIELLDWLLQGFYINDTRCPCSQYWCEKEHKGSHLSIAVVRKLKIADTFQEPDKAILQSISNFAFKLQNKVWNFGGCYNNLVLVYSQDDGVTFISYGETVGKTVNNVVISHIQQQYQHYFKEGGDRLTGFIEIILALRQTLNGYYFYDPSKPYFEQLVGGSSHVQSGVLATVGLAVLSRWLML